MLFLPAFLFICSSTYYSNLHYCYLSALWTVIRDGWGLPTAPLLTCMEHSVNMIFKATNDCTSTEVCLAYYNVLKFVTHKSTIFHQIFWGIMPGRQPPHLGELAGQLRQGEQLPALASAGLEALEGMRESVGHVGPPLLLCRILTRGRQAGGWVAHHPRLPLLPRSDSWPSAPPRAHRRAWPSHCFVFGAPLRDR